MSLQHRAGRIRLRDALHCWWQGHVLEHLPNGWWLCTRCARIRRTPTEMP